MSSSCSSIASAKRNDNADWLKSFNLQSESFDVIWETIVRVINTFESGHFSCSKKAVDSVYLSRS